MAAWTVQDAPQRGRERPGFDDLAEPNGVIRAALERSVQSYVSGDLNSRCPASRTHLTPSIAGFNLIETNDWTRPGDDPHDLESGGSTPGQAGRIT